MTTQRGGVAREMEEVQEEGMDIYSMYDPC